jgi:hypothetical protein
MQNTFSAVVMSSRESAALQPGPFRKKISPSSSPSVSDYGIRHTVELETCPVCHSDHRIPAAVALAYEAICQS